MLILETARMTLRRMTLSDVDGVFACFSDSEVMRHYPSTYDRARTEAWVQRLLTGYDRHGLGMWAACLRPGGEFIGQIGITPRDVEGQAESEIGYMLLRAHWGRGLASEGAIACRDYAFARLAKERVISLIDPANMRSQRVAEKVGMRPEREVIYLEKKLVLYSIEATQMA